MLKGYESIILKKKKKITADQRVLTFRHFGRKQWKRQRRGTSRFESRTLLRGLSGLLSLLALKVFKLQARAISAWRNLYTNSHTSVSVYSRLLIFSFIFAGHVMLFSQFSSLEIHRLSRWTGFEFLYEPRFILCWNGSRKNCCVIIELSWILAMIFLSVCMFSLAFRCLGVTIIIIFCLVCIDSGKNIKFGSVIVIICLDLSELLKGNYPPSFVDATIKLDGNEN